MNFVYKEDIIGKMCFIECENVPSITWSHNYSNKNGIEGGTMKQMKRVMMLEKCSQKENDREI